MSSKEPRPLPTHTAGPWEHNGNAVHKRVSPHFAECICVCEGENRHANAALIARAPELLTRVDELQSAYTDAARDVAELVETNQRLRELLLDVENASTIELAERIRKELDK